MFFQRFGIGCSVPQLFWSFSVCGDRGPTLPPDRVDEDGLLRQIGEIVASSGNRVHIIDCTDRRGDYMEAADVFCLPSYREAIIAQGNWDTPPCRASPAIAVSRAMARTYPRI